MLVTPASVPLPNRESRPHHSSAPTSECGSGKWVCTAVLVALLALALSDTIPAVGRPRSERGDSTASSLRVNMVLRRSDDPVRGHDVRQKVESHMKASVDGANALLDSVRRKRDEMERNLRGPKNRLLEKTAALEKAHGKADTVQEDGSYFLMATDGPVPGGLIYGEGHRGDEHQHVSYIGRQYADSAVRYAALSLSKV